MNTAAIKKIAIVQALSHIPETHLNNIKVYFDTLLEESQSPSQAKHSLKGIWRGAGFESLADLEGEIRNTRQGIQDDIVAREF
uniref:Uncharacterized protein n=1 Tax=Candidatus Kentrum sp. DK TaxID=2126562 RepID=A0A450T009_9GAMM|nr:MAG: hypothetical protein BECKDK2373B_GA0170837_10755 [Candidatus Kentron sp. DK]VFJ59821.1 MAG: hypothetical protein BECKDK2373C_GA0170839_10745 [Candidatus Kentron sp. DK]